MSDEGLTVGFFGPEDAEGVARLFMEVYGDEYPAKIVYRPDQLVAAFETREQIPIVVRTSRKEVVGYSSLFRAAPDRGVYEKGNGAVSPAFRNAGIMRMIFRHVRETLPNMLDITVLFGEPVCNHIYIQKAALAEVPFIETALEVGLMPAEAYEKEQSAPGRVSTLLMFITARPKPHVVHVPEIYEEYFQYIYRGLDDRRSFSRSGEGLPASETTRIETEIFASARVARLTVHATGSEFERAFSAEEERILGEHVEVIQVWLKLSWPWIGRAVALLKDKGYSFGGILPQWFGEDGLLMQKTLTQPDWEAIHLFSDRAKQILEFIRTDWQQ